MLAAIALTLCTVVLFKMKRERYAWVTIVPTTWLVVCTVTAGLEKVFSPNPGDRLPRPCAAVRRRAGGRQGAGAGEDACAEMGRIVFNDYVDATLAGAVRRAGGGDGGLRRDPLPPGDGQSEEHRHEIGGACLRRPAMTEARRATRLVCEMVVQTARLMVGVPDYQTYVTHRQTQHPDQPVMTYEEFFRERQDARYAVGKGRFRGCC